jgi:CBS domain-containing protein
MNSTQNGDKRMQTVSKELTLRAATARDLMAPNVLSISKETTVRDAAKYLFEKSISAAPVIDARGRPIGVISRSDIARHVARQQKSDSVPLYYYRVTLKSEQDEIVGVNFEYPEAKRTVADVMMAIVISVPQDASINRVIELMLLESIHRVFVTDEEGTLIGVISGFDILRKLMA